MFAAPVAAAASELLLSLTALDLDAWEVAADGLVVAVLSGLEKAEEFSSVVTVASVVLSPVVLASGGLVVVIY